MTTALAALRPMLDALATDQVYTPDQPIDVYLQETEDLLSHIAQNQLAAVLVDEGLERETLDGLPQALAATREAQTSWTLVNDRAKPDGQREAEARGYTLRAAIAKKARLALRRDTAGLAVLSQILEGEGLADLVQDLDDLNMLITQRASAFARNKNFDASRASSDLVAAATEIRKGLSGFRMNPEQSAAVDLRNRAWSYLDAMVDDIREAGRAATDGAIERGFASAYERRKRLAARRRKANDIPVTP